jgi:DNA-binding transcriptional LysR family regulator
MTLDVRRLQVLRQVALRGTIAAAAEAMAFTPSAVSQQLAALERETGADLLERSGRTVRLTDAGRVLVDHAEAVLLELDKAEAALETAMHQVAGTLHVGAFASVTAAILCPAVAALATRHPGLEVTIHDFDPSAALRALRLGELDVAVAHEYDHMTRASLPGVERRVLFTEPMFAVTPPGRFGPGASVDLSELAGDRFAAAPAGSDCGSAVRQACRAAGFEPDIRFNFVEFPVLLDLVRAGLAVSLLPALALSGGTNGLDVHRLSSGGFSRRIFTACRKGTTGRPGVSALLAELVAATESAPLLISALSPTHDALPSSWTHGG